MLFFVNSKGEATFLGNITGFLEGDFTSECKWRVKTDQFPGHFGVLWKGVTDTEFVVVQPW